MYNCPPKRKWRKFGAGNSKKWVFLWLFGNLPFRRAIFGGIWSNPSCAWMTALNRHFFAILLFYRCRFAFMVVFVPNRVDLPFFSQSVWIKPPVVPICLICFASFHPFGSIVSCCLWFENRVFWIACLLSESDVRFIGFEMRFLKSFVNRQSSFDVKERNPMWWLSSIPASVEEIGCMVGQCLFHLCINPMWCGSPTRWTIVQSQHLPIRCRLVLCLLYRRYFVQCWVDLAITKCCWFALGKSDAFGLNSLVRLPNRMLFAFGFLIADFNLHNRSIHVCKLDLGF